MEGLHKLIDEDHDLLLCDLQVTGFAADWFQSASALPEPLARLRRMLFSRR